MIFIDGIIYRLQKSGGISVMFNELLARMPVNCYEVKVPKGNMALSRYMDVVIKEKFKLFHSSYYRLPLQKSRAIVTTVHDFTYERYSQGPRKWLHSTQKYRAIRKADCIICISESTKRDLLEFCGSTHEDRIVVIPNGVSEDYFPIKKNIVKNQILFVGARSGYKNFASVVFALTKFPDIKLVCAGGGQFTAEESLFLESNLKGRYVHLGLITNAELNCQYNHALCLVYPSLYEGFGIPVVEAMRAGCPVLAVGRSSIPEVAGQSAYLMSNGEVEEISAGIEYFMVDKNREKYRNLGLKQSKNFCWDLTANRTFSVYEELLGYKLEK